MNSEAEVQVLVELLTDLNKSIIVFESLSKSSFRCQNLIELILKRCQCQKKLQISRFR